MMAQTQTDAPSAASSSNVFSSACNPKTNPWINMHRQLLLLITQQTAKMCYP